MTVETEARRVSYTADGVQDTFAYPFLIQRETDLQVFENNVLTTKAYSVTGVGDVNGGNVIFSPIVPTNGTLVTLVREVPYTQQVDYRPYDAFPAETHEGALDKLTMLTQQNRDGNERSVRGPASDPTNVNYVLAPVSERKNQFFVFLDDGSVGLSSSSTGPVRLADLTDVSLTNLQPQQRIQYDGALWRNVDDPYDIAFFAGFDQVFAVADLVVQQYATLIAPRAFAFTGDIGSIETAPVGSTVEVDIEVNGASIYSSKPSFAVTTGTYTQGVIPGNAFSVTAGQKIDFKVTQIGSGTAGQGVRFSSLGRP